MKALSPTSFQRHFRALWLPLVARVRKPTVVSYHSDIVRQRLLMPVYAPLMHRFLGSMQAIVATSPNYLETAPYLALYL